MELPMQPYSLDLRQRIIDAYNAGEGSIRELAERFMVSFRTVERYLALHRSTGSVAARPHAGGVPPRIDAQGLQILRSLVEEKNDRTVAELVEEFDQRTGIRVSRSSITRALKQLRITRKKKLSEQPNRTGRKFNASADAFCGRPAAWTLAT